MRTLVLVGLALIALASAAPAGAPMKVTIGEIYPDPVDYPKAPNTIVRIENRTGQVSAWVIRNLDGTIIHKYAAKPGEEWPITIEVHERTDDPLPTRAKGKDPIFPFTLAILNVDQVVVASAPFSVRIIPQGYTHTGAVAFKEKWWSADAYVAGGQLTEAPSTTSLEKKVKITGYSKPFILNKDVRITDAGKSLSSEEVMNWQPQTGQHVNLVYTERTGQDMEVSQIMIGKTAPSVFAPAVPKPWLTGSRFQIGNLEAQKPVKGEQVVIDVTTPQGRRSWLVTKTTEILAGVTTKRIEEVERGTLMAVAPEVTKTSELPAQQIILLQDRAGTP